MIELLHNPNFWYVLCNLVLILVVVFGIKGYLRKLLRDRRGGGKTNRVDNGRRSKRLAVWHRMNTEMQTKKFLHS